MKKSNILIITLIILFIALIITLNIFDIPSTCTQIIGALLSTVLTVAITALLLKNQTDKNIEHDCQVAIFEEKQKVYHEFINSLETLICDKNSDKTDLVKKALVHLSLIRMHADDKISNDIEKKVIPIITIFSINSKSREAIKIYPDLGNQLFEISNLLKEDLYNNTNQSCNKNKQSLEDNKKELSLSLTLAGLLNTDLRSSQRMIELHKQWWNNLIDYFSKIYTNFKEDDNYLFILNDNNEIKKIDDAINYFEKTDENSALSIKIGSKENIEFYFTMTFNKYTPIVFSFDKINRDKSNLKNESKENKNLLLLPENYDSKGFGNPGLGSKYIPEEFDIDFYNTNTNYYEYALASDEQKISRFIQPLVNSIYSDIEYFCSKNNIKQTLNKK